MFEPYLNEWKLVADGDPLATEAAHLLPVLHGSRKAMLKIAVSPEERLGFGLLRWWNGVGAVPILRFDDDAVLMDRATGLGSLVDMAGDGRDDAATLILCDTAALLHAARGQPPSTLVSLSDWFRPLPAAARQLGGLMDRCEQASRSLLGNPEMACALHGDLHHGNVLDFGNAAWLAIDPKGLVGERGFDFANVFCNPVEIPPDRDRFTRRLKIVADRAGLDRRRLLSWVLAWTGLSVAFCLGAGESPPFDQLVIAGFAAAELDR